MSPDLTQLNAMADHEAVAEMLRCCGARAWAQSMARARPFTNATALHKAADRALDALTRDDWMDAFAAHPRIGSSANSAWSRAEQAGMDDAGAAVRERLAAANEEYFARFGFIFLICATGKSAAEMLAALESRLHNEPELELQVAAEQQRLITHLRIDKLLAT